MTGHLSEIHRRMRGLEAWGVKTDFSSNVLHLSPAHSTALSADPSGIIQVIVLAADQGFAVDELLMDQMRTTACRLTLEEPCTRREELQDILLAHHASAALRMAWDVGVLPYLLGEQCFPPKSGTEQRDFSIFVNKVEEIAPDGLLRYALLFLCFEKSRAEAAIGHLQFPPEQEMLLVQALQLVMELHFIVRPLELKQFLAKYGRERYEFMDAVSKQQRKVYDQEESRILSRYYMLQEFDQKGLPIYMDDLEVSEAELEELGISDEKQRKAIMEALLHDVHRRPFDNKRDLLMKRVKSYKNPIVRACRKVIWMK